MAEIKGKFIMLACSLLESKPEAKAQATANVKRLTGREWTELDGEAWYDTKILNAVFEAIEENSSSILAWAAIKVIGQNVYPTIEKTVGLPKTLQTPLDFVKFEAEGFMANHRGPDVIPRTIISAEPGLVIVDAPSPGYNCSFIEGVFDGILIMCGIRNGEVLQTRCVKKGHSTCEYHIRW